MSANDTNILVLFVFHLWIGVVLFNNLYMRKMRHFNLSGRKVNIAVVGSVMDSAFSYFLTTKPSIGLHTKALRKKFDKNMLIMLKYHQ